MNEKGVVKELTPLRTVIKLNSGKELTFLNNSVLSGAVAIAKYPKLTRKMNKIRDFIIIKGFSGLNPKN